MEQSRLMRGFLITMLGGVVLTRVDATHWTVTLSGTEGTLAFPDPNDFTGDLVLTRRGSDEPEVIPAVGATSTRGSGVLEMARALREGRPHRAQGEMAYHVLDAMVSISGRFGPAPWRPPSRRDGDRRAHLPPVPVCPAPYEWTSR